MLDQVNEQIERLRLEVDRCTSATHVPTGLVDLAVSKPVQHNSLTEPVMASDHAGAKVSISLERVRPDREHHTK